MRIDVEKRLTFVVDSEAEVGDLNFALARFLLHLTSTRDSRPSETLAADDITERAKE